MPNPMRSFGLAPGVAWRRVSDQIVVLKLDSGDYYSLPESSASAWEWLLEELGEDEVLHRLKLFYDVPERTLNKDLRAFISDALSEKLLTPLKSAKTSASPKRPSKKRAYSRLVFKKHSTLDPKFYAMATY